MASYRFLNGEICPKFIKERLDFQACAPVDAIVKIANGHTFRGLGGVIAGFFRNQSASRRTARELNND